MEAPESRAEPVPTTTDLQTRMRADLTTAMKARDRRRISVLRTMLAAFANAEAPPAIPTSSLDVPVVGQLVEHERLVLDDADLTVLVEAEIVDRRDTAAIYRANGREEDAADLDAEVAILTAYVGS